MFAFLFFNFPWKLKLGRKGSLFITNVHSNTKADRVTFLYFSLVICKLILFKSFTVLFLQVEYQADAIHLELLGLAREGSPLISKLGEVPFLCQVRKPPPIGSSPAFKGEQKTLVLSELLKNAPIWKL